MRRRDFIAGAAGTLAWPLVARAQQGDRVRRIGWLMAFDENDPGAKRQISALTQALADLGWTDGRNVRMDLRWAGGDIKRIGALISAPSSPEAQFLPAQIAVGDLRPHRPSVRH